MGSGFWHLSALHTPSSLTLAFWLPIWETCGQSKSHLWPQTLFSHVKVFHVLFPERTTPFKIIPLPPAIIPAAFDTETIPLISYACHIQKQTYDTFLRPPYFPLKQNKSFLSFSLF